MPKAFRVSSRGARDHLRKYNARVLFLLGQSEESQTDVMEESALHADIVQEDFKVGETSVASKISVMKIVAS